MIIQLRPSIPLQTPKGPAIAHFMIDTGLENELQWVCFQDNTGECWTWRNRDVRAQKNITAGRDYISPFYDPEEVALCSSGEEEHECTQWTWCEDCETLACTYCGKHLKEIL